MRVYITGMYIPNTNMWEVPEDWTLTDLLVDVVKVMTAKAASPDSFTFENVDMSLNVCDNFEPDSEFKIIGS